MKLSYRNEKNARLVAAYYEKPLAKRDFWKVEASADELEEILLYDYIGWPFNDAFEIVNYLRSIKDKNVKVKINSFGGDVFDGLAIFNAMTEHTGNITVVIDSMAASMASIIAMGGKERQAYSGSMMVIHDPWTCMCGNQYELRETADILGKLSTNMLDIYVSNSNIGKRDLKTMMKDETWFTAKEMKERKLIDTIIDGSTSQAKIDFSIFGNVPEGFKAQFENGDNSDLLTIRDAEKALCDAGFPKNMAKALLARGWKPDAEEDRCEAECAESLKSIINSFGGK